MPLPERRRRLSRVATSVLALAVLAAAGFAAWKLLGPADATPVYRLAKVERGARTTSTRWMS